MKVNLLHWHFIENSLDSDEQPLLYSNAICYTYATIDQVQIEKLHNGVATRLSALSISSQ